MGLTLSALLSGYGVDHLLVEARDSTSRHPKARGISARSMEIFRRLGLEQAVRQAGLPADQVFFYRGRDLLDPDYTRTGLGHQPAEDEEKTPSPGLICSQDVLEPVLLQHATALAGPRITFGTRLVSFTDHGRGVLAEVEDSATGARRGVAADWLVGCDGAASTVRSLAGVAMEGPTGLGRYLSIRFEAPLGKIVADRASASYFLTVPGRGGFMAVDNDRCWIYQYPLPDSPDARPRVDFSDHGYLAELIRTAAGIPGLEVTVQDTMTWRMDAQLATAYRNSRVLLAGDSAHVIPPTGGHGMNTGIGDADNLAWKLAAVTAGVAGEALIDTYETERRPIARQVIGISTDNARARAGYRIDDELLLTAAYHSTAVIPAWGQPSGDSTLDPAGYRPTCRPGTRAPHIRLTGGPDSLSSTLDLIGPDFTVITSTGNPAWRRQADTARAAGLPVTALAVNTITQRAATPGQWEHILGTSDPDAALLVRPDGHIAWCADNAEASLTAALQRILARA